MLDMELFRNRRFTAASGTVTIALFAMSGFLFVATQYWQFVRNYAPFPAAVHMLPIAGAIGIGSVTGTKLALRLGTKTVVVIGLVGVGVVFVWASTVTATTTYMTLVAQMVLLGGALGLAAPPATESIIGAIPSHKAGVGSAVNDATRLVGGTLGVAVIGSAFGSVYASRISKGLPVELPRSVAKNAQGSVGAAFGVAKRLETYGWTELAGPVHSAATHAFQDGLIVAGLIGGILSIVGAILAAIWLPGQPGRKGEAKVVVSPEPALMSPTFETTHSD